MTRKACPANSGYCCAASARARRFSSGSISIDCMRPSYIDCLGLLARAAIVEGKTTSVCFREKISSKARCSVYVSPEERVPANHPLRPIRTMVDAVQISVGQKASIDNRLVHRVGKLRPQNSHACCHQDNANQLLFRVNPKIRAVGAGPAVIPWTAKPAAGAAAFTNAYPQPEDDFQAAEQS
jgi:hypothetical protein